MVDCWTKKLLLTFVVPFYCSNKPRQSKFSTYKIRYILLNFSSVLHFGIADSLQRFQKWNCALQQGCIPLIQLYNHVHIIIMSLLVVIIIWSREELYFCDLLNAGNGNPSLAIIPSIYAFNIPTSWWPWTLAERGCLRIVMEDAHESSVQRPSMCIFVYC